MAQGRSKEAEEHYNCGRFGPLPERTFRTYARWGWPFTIPLPKNTAPCYFWGSFGGKHIAVDRLASAPELRWTTAPNLELLVQQGINITDIPPSGGPPLFDAVRCGRYAAAKFLLDTGVTPVPPRDVTRRPCRSGQIEILRLFMQHTRVENPIRQAMHREGSCWGTNLRYRLFCNLAVDSGVEKIIEHIIALGADVHVSDNGQTAFERAVSRNSGWLVEPVY
ncbi:hypothetical protein B0T14DRAFT_129183 [Immersiella caudata]|uniref:Ankyrin n=1 Tax=Immersiella caudata TaxID=314043 RepID=A0AA39X4I4_9PEZI|nr:hypothetical protein B0T14DRAFT_129183 [Immersiella caudata]